jgi:taurine dioxygenase
MSYIEAPPTASVLYAVEVPSQGGDTHFASQYAAYEALPQALRELVGGLTLKHDAAHDSVGGLRPGFETAASPEHSPGAVHPIVRTHRETGRPALFLGRRPWAYIPGLALAESEALLDEIWSYVALPEHCFTQRWQVGDVVIWDNRCTLHRRAAFPADERRMMRRCQVLARS